MGGSLQEVQWLQAADTRQRMGRLETAGKAQWRPGATAAVGWREAEAEGELEVVVLEEAAAEAPMEPAAAE